MTTRVAWGKKQGSARIMSIRRRIETIRSRHRHPESNVRAICKMESSSERHDWRYTPRNTLDQQSEPMGRDLCLSGAVGQHRFAVHTPLVCVRSCRSLGNSIRGKHSSTALSRPITLLAAYRPGRDHVWRGVRHLGSNDQETRIGFEITCRARWYLALRM